MSLKIHRVFRSAPYFNALIRALIRNTPRWAKGSINKNINSYLAKQKINFVTKTLGDFDISGNTVDIIQRYIYLYGIWEPNLSNWITETLKKGDYFVDVGANIGYFTLLASRRIGAEGKVISIEASSKIFQLLASNVEINKANNVRLINQAVSDKVSTLQLYSGPETNKGTTSIFGSQDPRFICEGTIDARPLCDMLSREEISRARLIKIDIEGAELLAFQGLLPCLKNFHETAEFIIEIGGGPSIAPNVEHTAEEIINAMSDLNYHAYQLENDYSPESYITKNPPLRPTRIRALPQKGMDIVFSKRDMEVL